MKLQEYDSEQLEGIMNELVQLVDKYREKNPPLSRILTRDMGEIVREMFLRLAGPDQVNRRWSPKCFWHVIPLVGAGWHSFVFSWRAVVSSPTALIY